MVRMRRIRDLLSVTSGGGLEDSRLTELTLECRAMEKDSEVALALLKDLIVNYADSERKLSQALAERDKALESLREELDEAVNYVRTTLPSPLLKGPVRTDWRFFPSSSLGGDSFGYHWLDKDNFAVYLLDVSGHGVGAALLSVSVINVLRSQSLPDVDFREPDEVLEALNQAFPVEEHNGMFFTIWYGVYQQSTRVLKYAGGGHPPAFFVPTEPAGEYHLVELYIKNMFIGNQPDFKYRKDSIKLDGPGRLYVFSDGVFEIRREDDSLWPFQEFKKLMAQPPPKERSQMDVLLNQVRTLSQRDTFEDDFSILEVTFE